MGTAGDTDRSVSSVTDRVHRVEFDIEWPPKHVAMYLIEGPEPILVDAGAPGADAREQFVDGLDALGYDPADVDHVVVTHPHTDHTGQVPTLLDGDAKLYAARPVLEQLDRDPDDLERAVRETARGAGLPTVGMDEQIARAVDSLERNRELLPPDRVHHVFEFGEPFDVAGHRFTPIHTPGHQIHHACFAVDLGGETTLFAGDALIKPFRAAALHVGLDRESYDAIDAFYRGVDRLRDHHVDRVFPGHGPTFTDYDAVLDRTTDRLDDLVADVADHLDTAVDERGPSSPLGVTLARVGTLNHPAPLFDTIGALGYLERHGRCTHERDDDGVRRYTPIRD